jgi:hypothetical protein
MAGKFLIKYDYQTLIDEDNLNELTDGNDRLLNDAVDSAVEKVAGYIRHRYDAALVFKVVQVYSDTTAFVIGDRIFWEETAYSELATYATNDRVSYSGSIYEANQAVAPEAFDPAKWDLLAENETFYVCSVDSIGNLPSSTAYFTAGDDRNALIKEITVDVVLYNIHSKVSPRNIPDVRRVRYDGTGNLKEGDSAIATLMQCQKGNITLNLPVVTPDVQNTQRVSYGVQSNSDYNY